ncbi:MAG: Histone-lysine N-methyltransferase ezh1 [Vezdaea aestivalis]|nr:MAG: Histone-lysine N-methyltransferase ezh1 [Vezdaea aestivalis]
MSKSAIYERCNNISLQKGVHKPLLVGKSELTGNGAFIAVSGEVHDFVGEYTGEIIDEQESQRRGRVYDAKGLSYIFTINKDSAIDASTFGTKVRFINHSQVRENCAPKVLFVNGMHRIGIWLKAPVKAGQELFMNYGDQFIEATADIRDFEQTKAALTAPRPKPEITRHTGRMTGQKKSGLTLRIQGSAPKPQSRSDRAKSREVRGIRTKDPSPPLSKAETDSPLSDPPTGDNSEEDKEDIRPLSHQRRS